ncbi:tyrosine kinase receptor Cad96Ca-like [Ptychodera flava]|uniref:tyrosine kinase receptor Cad96Ca-like n=1 Tax=Ptychodera flava TaxID=63121 RepID=UPI00396A30AF
MQIVRKSNAEYGVQESSDVSVTPAVVIPLIAIVAIILGVIFYCKRMKKTQTHSAKIVYVKNSDESSSRPEEGALGNHDVVMPSVIINKYKQHNNGKSNSTDSEGIYEEPIDRLYNSVDEVKHYAPLSVYGKAEATYSHLRRSDNIDVSWEFLSFLEVLNEGAFGKVVKAEAWNIAGRDGNSVVAVKILKDNVSIADKQHFLNELVAMRSVGAHQNVIALLGCCRDSEPYCIILEYMARGNLKNYLWTCNLERATDANYENGNWMLRSSSLLNYAHQVAIGMAYISSKQCVHRDLSARNVLLNEHDVCKISGFGLSSNVMNERQYKRRTLGRLPIRWMAVEVMDARAFTTNSDVWSFGVVIWEIANLGNKPYAGMSNKKVTSSVQEGIECQNLRNVPQNCTPSC